MTSIWDDQYKAGQGRYFPAEELVRFLGRTYGPVTQQRGSGLTAVEIGSGVGGNVRALAEWGFFTYGLELSHEAIKLATQYANEKGFADMKDYRQYVAPAPIHLPAKCANLVIDVQTIQHLSLTEHEQIYKEIHRLLCHGGRFFTMHWVGHELSARQIFPAHPELSQWQDVPAVVNLVEQAGMTVTYKEVVSKTYVMWIGRWLVLEAAKA